MNSSVKVPESDCPKSRQSQLNQSRMEILRTPIVYVHDDRFDQPNEVHDILESSPDCVDAAAESTSLIRTREFLLPRVGLLSQEDEQTLFLSMNCRKFLAEKRRLQALARKPTGADVRFIERMLSEANNCRQKIATANQRLVVSISARFAVEGLDLSDLVGEGNLNLLKAIDLFNVGRGFRFSTYATYAIRRHLSRIQKREWTRKNRWSNEIEDPIIEEEDAEWIDQHPGKLVQTIMLELPDRERQILCMRFGLAEFKGEHTYEEIGERFGISKERVRQLIVRSCSQANIRHAKTFGLD